MRLRRMSVRGMMSAIAVVALVLGTAINIPWLIPLFLLMVLITAPQTIIVALCAYLAIRGDGEGGSADEPGGADEG